jgi:hypothetical protein
MPLGGLSSPSFPSHDFYIIDLFSFNSFDWLIDRLLLLFNYKYKYGFYRVELRVVLKVIIYSFNVCFGQSCTGRVPSGSAYLFYQM